jgi:hypothetical protein
MASQTSPPNRAHLKRSVQPPAKVLAAAPVKVGDRVQAFANLLKKKQLMPGSIRVIIPESNQVDVDFDGIKTAGAMVGRDALTASLSRGRMQWSTSTISQRCRPRMRASATVCQTVRGS